jgi:hypothetical protein
VTGFPTIKVFRDGTPMDYEGPRDPDGILEELAKYADYKPPVDLSGDAAAAKALMAESKCLLVGFFRKPVAAR